MPAGAACSLTCCEPALLDHEGAPRGLHDGSRVHLGLALQDSKGGVTVRPVTSASQDFREYHESSPCAPPLPQRSDCVREAQQAQGPAALQAACPAAVAPRAREWPVQRDPAAQHPGQGCPAWPLGQA